MLRLVLLRLLESYFRHRWLYLMPIVLMLGLATAYISLKKPLYFSEGIMYVQGDSLLSTLTSIRNDGFSWLTPAQGAVEEINDLLRTDAFIRVIVSKTDLEAEMSAGLSTQKEVLSEARKSVWVQTAGNNQLLISAAHEEPQITAQLVNALIESYVQWQINAGTTESKVARDFFQNLMAEYGNDLELARRSLDEYLLLHPEPERGERPQIERNQLSILQSNVQLVEQRYVKALENDELTRLEIARVENTTQQAYYLIDAPEIPKEPEVSLKDLAVTATMFMVVGIILSGIGIVGGVLLDRSLRVPLDVQVHLGLPVLATVPDVSALLMQVQEEEPIVAYEREATTDLLSATTGQKFNQGAFNEPKPISRR